MGKLLTIAIPTYNRSEYLALCLNQIYSQIDTYSSRVEIIVSDNNSDDDTEEIIRRFNADKNIVIYIKNTQNVGADRNVAQCFDLAKGKYVLILGDDDVLLDGSIKKIIELLGNEEYGMVYINPYSFKVNYLAERPMLERNGVFVYNELEEYFKRINYMVTFLSSGIVNKSIIKHINPYEFVGTNMPQLYWFLSAIFKADKNACIENYIVAARSENTGGYQLCQVFGVNINKIFENFVSRGVDRKYFDIINKKLLQIFFPHFLILIKRQIKSSKFKDENYFKVLFPVFYKYISFWLITVPIIYLPRNLATLWNRLCGRFQLIISSVRFK